MQIKNLSLHICKGALLVEEYNITGPAFGIKLQLVESLIAALISGVKLQCGWGQGSFRHAKLAQGKAQGWPKQWANVIVSLKDLAHKLSFVKILLEN